MLHPVLKLIIESKTSEEIQRYVQQTKMKLPLFIALDELGGKSVYSYLKRYIKFHGWDLTALIKGGIIDLAELDSDGNNLMQCLLAVDDLLNFQQLLLQKQSPSKELFEESEDTQIGDFLRYRPGRNKATVYEHVSKRIINLSQLSNLIYDFQDTTAGESSDGELSDVEELTPQEASSYNKLKTRLVKKYNESGEHGELLVLAAARGVHFVPKYFTKAARDDAYNTRHQSHTTYSFSTLIDAGYEAGDEPDEDDEKIRVIDQRNKQFIATLKATEDKKEKKSGGRVAPAARNNKEFDNLFWRELQVYINSYSTLFNFKGIQTNFNFASLNNPHISLTWKTDVAGMYGSGVRSDVKRGERRDPHYRRYDGKPKHPTLGYIDVFELPLAYVRTEGVDRLLAYNDHKIDLSNIYLAEAEVIFHSMIPQQHHVRRYMIVLPSFSKVTSQSYAEKEHFGMQNSGAYTRARNALFNCINGEAKGDAYQDWVTQRAKHAVEAQAVRIDKATDVRLFRQGKVRIYDHGDTVAATLPGPAR